jgi:hypothetical protein
MKGLRVLRLADTRLTDAAISHLEGLTQLESLSVYGTQITPAVLPAIEKLPKLAHFYVGRTRIQPEATMPARLAGKLVF